MDFSEYFKPIKQSCINNGISIGDIVYIGSDISAILLDVRRRYSIKSKKEQYQFLDQFVECFQELVGVEGTLLFPFFSWTFCKGEDFLYNKTLCEIGVLNNYILEYRKDFKRTRHPIYGFLVWGKDSDYLKNLSNQDSWSEDSPFGYLYKKNAKQINVNVPFNKCITFQHFVEQCAGVPYRYKKYFIGNYVDDEGILSQRIYSMYVRDLKIQSKPNLPENFFVDNGAATVDWVHDYKFIFMQYDKIFDVIYSDLKNNGGKNLYVFDNYSFSLDDKATHSAELKLCDGTLIEIGG